MSRGTLFGPLRLPATFAFLAAFLAFSCFILQTAKGARCSLLYSLAGGPLGMVKYGEHGRGNAQVRRGVRPEYETKQTKEEWKGRLFRPAGFPRHRGSSEKSCRISEGRIDLLSR